MKTPASLLALVAALAAMTAMIPAQAYAQCAMCVTALQNSAEGRMVAQSFGNGILFLLAAPYLILCTVAYTLYRAYRKKAQPTKGVL
jgi:hypothetical protein